MIDRIPTEADWHSEPWDLDIPRAYDHFAGRSLEEATELFKDDALYYQEDVMFMPKACLSFYTKAYITYLMSEASKGDADGANCFFGLIEVRLADIFSDHQLASLVADCLEHLAVRQDWYDAVLSFYGSFSERARQLSAKLRRLPLGG